jgi:DNA topoisomerase-3
VAVKLCIAEKPSVGRDIARVIGANTKHDGFYEGNGYRVTWAVGHLITLSEPEEYGYVNKTECFGEGKQKAIDELPLIPSVFKYNVIPTTASQFNIVKKLMQMSDVDVIIDCGDMGAEGHILQWLIRNYVGCNKKVLRFCATSMTDEAITKAMNDLQPIDKFENIIKGELCKKKADWILGMSMSRALSIKFSAGINVGRVQSPTLYFVVKRFLEVQNFKVTDYFTMSAELNEGIKVDWNKDADNVCPVSVKDSDGRVLDKSFIEKSCCDILSLGKGVVSELKKEKKANERPQLYDITELQRQANVLFGYSAAVTLATAQSLYENHKLLSYPRTDSRYITTDLAKYLKPYIEALSILPRYSEVAKLLLDTGLNIDKRIVDDSKVTDHHALLPTNNIAKYDGKSLAPMSDDVKKGVTVESLNNIFDLVLCRLIVSLSTPYIYEHTTIKVSFDNDFIFSASGKKPLKTGWRGLQDTLLGKGAFDTEADDDIQIFPDIKQGQTVTLKNCVVVPKKTTPPKLHTEATLLTAMENAGALLENGKILKGKGIGTQATRAEIISKLFNTGVIEGESKGKKTCLKPTSKGISVIRVMPEDLYSPKITADWETIIAEIAKGKMTDTDFMDKFIPFITAKVSEVKTSNATVSFKKDKEVHGVCPWCKSDLYRYDKTDPKSKKLIEVSMYCSEKCGFSISSINNTFQMYAKKTLTVTELKKLVAKGFLILDCPSDKGFSTRRGKFTFYKKETDSGKVYCNIKCEIIKAE